MNSKNRYKKIYQDIWTISNWKPVLDITYPPLNDIVRWFYNKTTSDITASSGYVYLI